MNEKPFDYEKIKANLEESRADQRMAAEIMSGISEELEGSLTLRERIDLYVLRFFTKHLSQRVGERLERKANQSLDQQVKALQEKMDELSAHLESAEKAYLEGMDSPEAEDLKKRFEESERRLSDFLESEGYHAFSPEYIERRKESVEQQDAILFEQLSQDLSKGLWKDLSDDEIAYCQLAIRANYAKWNKYLYPFGIPPDVASQNEEAIAALARFEAAHPEYRQLIIGKQRSLHHKLRTEEKFS